MNLVGCPACGNKVSAAAVSCIHCGHPMRATSAIPLRYAYALIIVLLALALGVATWRLSPASKGTQGASASDRRAELSVALPEAPRLSQEELNREITSYILRINRLTPYKPNETVTLQRVRYSAKPMEVTYEYEMTAASKLESLSQDSLAASIRNRYCSAEDMALFSRNNVPVTFAYYSAGHLKRELTVSSC